MSTREDVLNEAQLTPEERAEVEMILRMADIDRYIAAQRARLAERGDIACQHEWGTAYKSSSGRKVCVRCGHVTDKPFDSLGVGEA